jgi:hypothetical protein
MEVDAILCNHAEAAENKLYLAGGGIDLAFVVPQPPHVVVLGLGVVIHVPYQSTNEAHTLTIKMLDEDGDPVVPFVPEGMPPMPPVEFNIPFNVGRPTLITAGDDQALTVAANFVGVPLGKLGKYEFVIEIEGTVMRRLPLRVRTQPTQPTFPMIPGLPPAQ